MLHPSIRDLIPQFNQESQRDLTHLVDKIGRGAASLAAYLLHEEIADRSIVVLCGPGVIGGCGVAAARHLLAQDAWVQVILSGEVGQPSLLFEQQLSQFTEIGGSLAWAEEGWELPPADLVIDALTNLETHVASESDAHLIQLANSTLAPTLSLAMPAGVNLKTGQVAHIHVHADATLMLTWPEEHLLCEAVRMICGKLYLANLALSEEQSAMANHTTSPAFRGKPFRALSI